MERSSLVLMVLARKTCLADFAAQAVPLKLSALTKILKEINAFVFVFLTFLVLKTNFKYARSLFQFFRNQQLY